METVGHAMAIWRVGDTGMDNVVAIDFETANYSACAVGIATVRDGRVAEVYSSLIRPPILDFVPRFIQKHNITPEMVQDAPTFVDIWPEIQSRCDQGIIAAHNATFDVDVLRACTAHYGLPQLTGRYFCTLSLARKFLPDSPSHKLNTLADHFGIPLNHHDATSDAVACAELGIRFEQMAGPEGIGKYFAAF